MQIVTRSIKALRPDAPHSKEPVISRRAITRAKRAKHRQVRRATRRALKSGQDIPDIRPLTSWDLD